jgi:diguanylate cyclase (GGDEF)-like protein
MEQDIHQEFERLKKEFLASELTYQKEKDCLLKVVSAFGFIVDTHPQFQEKYRSIKQLSTQGNTLPVGKIEQAVDALKSKFFTLETKGEFTADEGEDEKVQALTSQLRETCLSVKRIAAILLDDFYPVTQEMMETAKAIQINCRKPIVQEEFNQSTAAFMAYIHTLKQKISHDFSYINDTFLGLLDQIKALEKALKTEVAGGSQIQEIERFEQNIQHEMGSIQDSFTIQNTVEKIKESVVNRLSNIQHLVTVRKKKEMKKIQKAKKNILNLRKRINLAEKDAKHFSKQARHFRTAAMTDGLTGLYNRKAFDQRIQETLKLYNAGGKPFLLMMFDVNKFKWINDRFGHVAGDKVLQMVARTLQETFRKTDFIARYGGDEFAVLLEHSSETLATQRIQYFHEKFRKKRFSSHQSGNVQVSLSAGFALVEAGDTSDDIIHKADTSMYEIKKQQPAAEEFAKAG